MEITLPWLTAFTFLILFAGVWNYYDHRDLYARIEDVDDRGDRDARAVDERLELHGQWIRYLDARLPADEPQTQPIPLPDDDGPDTEPQGIVIVRNWADGVTDPWPRQDEPESYGRHALRADDGATVTEASSLVVPVGAGAGEEQAGSPATTTEED